MNGWKLYSGGHMKAWVYKSDLTGHWIVDRYGPKPLPQYECIGGMTVRLYPTPNGQGRLGFTKVERAWAHGAEQVDEFCARQETMRVQQGLIEAEERRRYPWLYENGGHE